MSVAAFGQLGLDIIFSSFKELPKLGEEVFAKQFDIQLSGGSITAALIFKRLGVPFNFSTFYSDDLESQIVLKLLEKEGMTELKNFYKNESGKPIAVTSVMSFEKDRSFLSYNEFFDESKLSEKELYDFFKDSKICFATRYHPNLLKKLKSEGKILVFDLGWEEKLRIENLKDVLKYVDIYTPNQKEAMHITKAKNPEDALLILGQYVKYPIVKLGAEGCITLKEGKIIKIGMPCKFNAIDTTGAGDNFLAGVVYGLYKDMDIINCMKLGNIFGGISTTELGCHRGVRTLEKIEKYMSMYEKI